jgi:hypothetical protein
MYSVLGIGKIKRENTFFGSLQRSWFVSESERRLFLKVGLVESVQDPRKRNTRQTYLRFSGWMISCGVEGDPRESLG